MKGLVLLCLVFALGIDLKELEGVKQQVGQSCKSNSEFQVSGFNVSPWPLTKGVEFTLTMSGTFLHDAEVSSEYIQVEYNHNKKNNTIIDVKARYKQGDYQSFVLNDNAGSLSGVYTYTIALHWNKILYDEVLSCWSFTYQI